MKIVTKRNACAREKGGPGSSHIPGDASFTQAASLGTDRGLLDLLLPLPSHDIVVPKVAPKNVQRAAYRQVYAPRAELAHLQAQEVTPEAARDGLARVPDTQRSPWD